VIIRTTGALVGHVARVAEHPNASQIRLAHVNLDNSETTVQIVFGGLRELFEGDLVPVAPPGARVTAHDCAKQKKMRARNYRGQRSHGMLCSLNELGWVVDGRDEVAVLCSLRRGDSLDKLPVDDRHNVVKNWSGTCQRSDHICASTTSHALPSLLGVH
jgi:tRNA-binding EMAP/Myf-like protein